MGLRRSGSFGSGTRVRRPGPSHLQSLEPAFRQGRLSCWCEAHHFLRADEDMICRPILVQAGMESLFRFGFTSSTAWATCLNGRSVCVADGICVCQG